MTEAEAARARAYRARNGAGTVRGPAASAPCGTVSAYKRHRRRGEPVDEPCRAAWALYQKIRYQTRRTK